MTLILLAFFSHSPVWFARSANAPQSSVIHCHDVTACIYSWSHFSSRSISATSRAAATVISSTGTCALHLRLVSFLVYLVWIGHEFRHFLANGGKFELKIAKKIRVSGDMQFVWFIVQLRNSVVTIWIQVLTMMVFRLCWTAGRRCGSSD